MLRILSKNPSCLNIHYGQFGIDEQNQFFTKTNKPNVFVLTVSRITLLIFSRITVLVDFNDFNVLQKSYPHFFKITK